MKVSVNDNGMGIMSFYFSSPMDVEPNVQFEKARIHVSLDHDLPVIRVDVDLDELPPITYDGNNVMVNFRVERFDHGGVFYTDSNGLEMQKRVLNHRDDWDINYNYGFSNDNITANFYPINSAISMKDKDSSREIIVMNDRP